jgi:hypothetical protein
VELPDDLPALRPDARPQHFLGTPLNIREVARLIGCSPWTVRQKLIPMGLPYVRFGASSKLIFYTDQVLRWIQKLQGGKSR